jgi:hypothetical protein
MGGKKKIPKFTETGEKWHTKKATYVQSHKHWGSINFSRHKNKVRLFLKSYVHDA